MRNICLILLFALTTMDSFSQLQRIKISGPTNVIPNCQTHYELLYPAPQGNCKWLVSGGTIISKNIIPGSPIFCNVLWDQNVSTGGITLIVNGMSSNLEISILESNCMAADAGSDVSICNSSVIIGTPAIPGYSYSWSPSTGLNNPNIAQPTASPSASTTYTLTMTPSASLLINGAFEQGYSNFSSDYPLFPNAINGGSNSGGYGTYLLSSNPQNQHALWCNMPNHSAIGSNMLITDGEIFTPEAYRFWFTTINVQQNTDYTFSGWAGSASGSQSKFRITMTGNNTGITTSDIDLIPTFNPVSNSYCNYWQSFQTTWNSGTNTQITIDLRFRSFGSVNNNQYQNDLCLDDLSFTNCPPTTDQVTVSVCGPCAPNETVKILNNANQLTNGGGTLLPYTIDPAKTNVVCYPWESGDRLKLQSSFPNGNTWYFNGTAIPASMNAGDEFFTLSSCMQYNNPSLCQSPNLPIEIRVSNPNSCNGTSTPIYVHFNPLYGNQEWFNLRIGNSTTITLIDYGAGSFYTWHNNYPGMTITPLNSNNSSVSIFMPSSYANSTINIPIDLTNPWCSNNSYNNTSSMCTNYCINNFTGIFQVNLLRSEDNLSKISAYPNPANSQVNIKSDETIIEIEIFDLLNPVSIKKIRPNSGESVNVDISNFKPGLYICKVSTKTKTQNIKLQIVR